MSNTSKKSVNLTPKPLMTISGHESYICNVAYLPGGERVATCSDDKTVRMWNVENGEQEGTSMEHNGWVEGLAVTKDGKKILSGGEDEKIRVWNVETHEPIEEWGSDTGGILCIAMSPEDQLAASGGNSGKIVIREMKLGGPTKHSIQAGSVVHSLSFSPNGERLAAAVEEYEDDRTNCVIQVYDVENGELILGPIKGHEAFVRCVLWSLDGSWLFSASNDRTIRCWNSETGEPIGQPWTGHTDGVASLSLSPDGTKLASASWDSTVCFWDVHSGDPIDQPLQHENVSWPGAVTFSPSGEFVATGCKDNKLSIWRVPWWDDIQKQAHDSFLDLAAVPVPKDLLNAQARHGLDFFDLPSRPITSSQPFARLTNPTTSAIVTRVQLFWHRLVARYFASSLPQETTDLQPMQERRFWKSPVRIPVTEVAAGQMSNRVVVGRRERRRKKKQASSTAEAGPSSSHAQPSGATSNANASTSQAGPSLTSNSAAQRRTSSFAQSDVGSDDSWDDMDCCGKCLDYFCVGPRADRERFRPWKKKPRAVVEADERAREEKKREEARGHATNNRTRTQKPVRPSRQHAARQNHTSVVSPVPPLANGVTSERPGNIHLGGADRVVILQLQEQMEQLRRHFDDTVSDKRKAEAERDALKKKVEELQYNGREPHKSQEHTSPGSPVAEAGPSLSHAEPSGCTPTPSTFPAGPPTSSSSATEGHPSILAQSHLRSIEVEERTKEEKRRAKAEKKRARRKRRKD